MPCEAEIIGLSVPLSSMNSPKLLSSLSPTGRSRLTGCRPIFNTRRTSSMLISADAGDLLRRRLAAQFLQQPLGNVAQPREHVDHVDRNANRAGLIGDGPSDRLPNPPGGIGRKLVAAAIFVFIDRPHQARISFLDQVQEAQAAVAIFLGDRHDQPQIAAGKLPLDLLEILELPAP